MKTVSVAVLAIALGTGCTKADDEDMSGGAAALSGESAAEAPPMQSRIFACSTEPNVPVGGGGADFDHRFAEQATCAASQATPKDHVRRARSSRRRGSGDGSSPLARG